MTPEERYEALGHADAQALSSLADRILAAAQEVEVVAGPEAVTAPVRLPVPGTASTTAVIGHVALTTCTITVDSTRGDGCRRGRDLPGAVAAAVCDAEAARGGPLAAAVSDLAAAASRDRVEARRQRALAVELTRLGADA